MSLKVEMYNLFFCLEGLEWKWPIALVISALSVGSGHTWFPKLPKAEQEVVNSLGDLFNIRPGPSELLPLR